MTPAETHAAAHAVETGLVGVGALFAWFLVMVVVGWFVFSLVPAIIANHKGRSGVGFYLLSVFFSPVVGLIGALIISRDQAELDRRIALKGGR